MADKQIGIRLDVKQTGLQQVDDALDTISKNLGEMNKSVIAQQQKGWGSETQTKELREQLRYMTQMTQLYERIARTQGRSTETFGNFRSEISRMQGDLGSVPTYRNNAGGWIHKKFGEDAAQSVEKLTGALAKLGAMYAGFNALSTLHSGMERGDQLVYGYGSMNKRMNPSAPSSIKATQNFMKTQQGFGNDNLDIMKSATEYGNVTGRMNPNTFESQMRAIQSTGQRYGWDLGQATSVFSGAYSSGATGGSTAQMNPQEFATLVANATVSAHMQGRESKMVEQLAQVTQMTVGSMGKAGDQKTISSVLAMGDSTGNQGIINNLPNMLNGINQGITNPNGGYGGQALMMRAIGGGKMNFWDLQMQMSKGAFGREEDADGNEFGPTNMEKATDYLMKTFGTKNKNRTYSMIGQMFGMNPAQAKQYVDTYTKDGKFNSDALNKNMNEMNAPAVPAPLSDSDEALNNKRSLQNSADQVGTKTTGFRSMISGLASGVTDVLGEPLSYIATGAAGVSGLGGIYKYAKKFMQGGAKSTAPVEPVPSVATPSAAGSLPSRASRVAAGAANAASKGGGFLGGLGRFLGPLGTVMTAETLGHGVDDLFDWTLGHKKGEPMRGRHFWENTTYQDDKAPIWRRSDADPASSASGPVSGPPSPTASGGSVSSGTALAPVVLSTILALAPYMGQIQSAMGVNPAVKTARSEGSALDNPRVQLAPVTPKTGGAVVQLASYKNLGSGGSPTPKFMSSGPTGKHSTIGNSGVSVSKIDEMLKDTSLDGHGQDFIDAAGEYGIDPAALVGLVRAEQSFSNPYGSNNLTGITNDMGLGDGRMFGANDGQKLPGFKSIKDGLRAASKNLRSYAKGGTTSIDDVAKKWVGNSKWTDEADTINKTMDQLSDGTAVHSSVSETAYNGAQNGRIKVEGGTINVNVKTESGTQTFKAPISAEYTGISI